MIAGARNLPMSSRPLSIVCFVLVMAGCARETEPGNECMVVPDDTTTCPTGRDVRPRDLTHNCGPKVHSVDGPGELTTGAAPFT